MSAPSEIVPVRQARSAPRSRERLKMPPVQPPVTPMILGQDLLDVVASALLDQLQQKPVECLRHFFSLCCATRWKPSSHVYRVALGFFTLSGDVGELLRRENNANNANNQEERALVRLHVLLRSLDRFANPLRELPTSIHQWKHAYFFLSQLKKIPNCDGDTVLTSIQHAASRGALFLKNVLQDDDDKIYKSCRRSKQRLRGMVLLDFDVLDNDDMETTVARFVQSEPFLISRSGCTPIMDFPTMWVDERMGEVAIPNRFLTEWLKHDPFFLQAVDPRGTPSSHSFFTLSTSSTETLSVVMNHPSFNINQRSLLLDETVVHALVRFVFVENSMQYIFTTQPDVYSHNKLMLGKELIQKKCNFPAMQRLFTHKNKQGRQPFQVCGAMVVAVSRQVSTGPTYTAEMVEQSGRFCMAAAMMNTLAMNLYSAATAN
jgi:hypothetical protein